MVRVARGLFSTLLIGAAAATAHAQLSQPQPPSPFSAPGAQPQPPSPFSAPGTAPQFPQVPAIQTPTITNLPQIPFYLVLCITGLWFIVSAGRFIPAQAMVSNVVLSERRGSFMSFNSSVQQIFVGLASVIAGLIVVKLPDNRLDHYEITGYISIGFILFSIVIATMLHKRTLQTENVAAPPDDALVTSEA